MVGGLRLGVAQDLLPYFNVSYPSAPLPSSFPSLSSVRSIVYVLLPPDDNRSLVCRYSFARPAALTVAFETLAVSTSTPAALLVASEVWLVVWECFLVIRTVYVVTSEECMVVRVCFRVDINDLISHL